MSAPYNYAVFSLAAEEPRFDEFMARGPHVGERAPDFPLEDLETGEAVGLSELWSRGVVIVEFGSFT